MIDKKKREVGPYQRSLNVGDEQVMVFQEGDKGPFYIPDNHRIWQKYDRMIGKRKVVTKTKKKIKEKLKMKGHVVRVHCSKE